MAISKQLNQEELEKINGGLNGIDEQKSPVSWTPGYLTVGVSNQITDEALKKVNGGAVTEAEIAAVEK